jgi:methionine synthase II (cobalamin-independent)
VRIVKSTDDLKRLALARGASASIGGAKFNSSSEQVADVKRPEEKKVSESLTLAKPETPEPAAKVAPAEAPGPSIQSAMDVIGEYATSADELSKSNAQVITEIQKAIAQLSQVAQPVAQVGDVQLPRRQWKLTVNRDTRGLLQSIDVEQQ